MSTTTTSPFQTEWANKCDTYEAGLMSLFSGKPEDTERDLEKMFTPTFTQRDDETTRDFSAFVSHIQWLRDMLPEGSVRLSVVQFLRDGNQLGERHMSTTTLPDGRVLIAETFQFAEVAEDGRIAWIVENVKNLDGNATSSRE
jgi:hypothetical protein